VPADPARSRYDFSSSKWAPARARLCHRASTPTVAVGSLKALDVSVLSLHITIGRSPSQLDRAPVEDPLSGLLDRCDLGKPEAAAENFLIPHYRIAGQIRFDPHDLDAWVRKHLVDEVGIDELNVE